MSRKKKKTALIHDTPVSSNKQQPKVHVSFRLKQLLKKGEAKRRGLPAEIEKKTAIDHHTVTAMLNNTIKSVTRKQIELICDYLIEMQDVDPRILPGALFGFDPEYFWEMLANCRRVEFCVGARYLHDDKDGPMFVISDDSDLHSMILAKTSQFDLPAGKGKGRVRKPSEEPAHRLFPRQHLVMAPPRGLMPDGKHESWEDAKKQSEDVYNGCVDADTKKSAFVALGTPKVNSVISLMLGRTFGVPAFAPQDNVARPRDRSCPIFFRYRDDDATQPPSCCGGLRLAQDDQAPTPGIYYEGEDGTWHCCPWDKDHDVAFVYYEYCSTDERVELACGGFSLRATRFLTESLESIAQRLWPAQYVAGDRHIGLFLVTFALQPSDDQTDIADKENVHYRTEVIRIPDDAIRQRLGLG